MVAEGVPIKRETYVAVLMDRESNGPLIVASPAGGVDIETVAQETPDLIFKVCCNATTLLFRLAAYCGFCFFF